MRSRARGPQRAPLRACEGSCISASACSRPMISAETTQSAGRGRGSKERFALRLEHGAQLCVYTCVYIYIYLVAFGQSRHRAWVVGQRPHGCWLGSRGWPVGGPWEAVWRPLGGRFGASWGLIWAFWGPLGASWGALGGLLGPLWGLLRPPWGSFGRKTRFFSFFPPLGPLLGPSWSPLGPSWAPLGPSWGPLGPSWGRLGGLLGRLGVVLGHSWAILKRQDDEKARKPKTFKNPKEINDFGLLGPSWEGSWGSLGTSWRPLGQS